MTAARQISHHSTRFTLTVGSGGAQGSVYQLLPPKVTIGRDPENDIVLIDPRTSRNSCQIEFEPEGLRIRDISGRQNLYVNGSLCSDTILNPGDLIFIGDTQLVFQIERPQATPQMLATTSGPGASASPTLFQPPPIFGGNQKNSDGFAPPPRPTKDLGSLKKRLIMYGVPLAIVAWLFTSSHKKVVDDDKIRTEDEIETGIQTNLKEAQQIQAKKVGANEEERTRMVEANKHFSQGFRDFQKGQYGRAIRSFETARAIDPQLELARRYQVLAERRRDEMVREFRAEAIKYKEKSMFPRCAASAEKALNLMSNKNEVAFKELDALFKFCDANAEGRF